MSETGKTIWKFPIPLRDIVAIQMPQGAEFLAFQAQHNSPCAWFRVAPGAPQEIREFRVAGTGHPIGDEHYLGTCQVNGGSLVFHLFESCAAVIN